MIRILHLVGSCVSDSSYQLSLMYASSCQDFGEFEFIFAVIYPDKRWTFTSNLDSLKDESKQENAKMNLSDAINHITTVVQPDVAINHLFCQAGSVYYRALMEMLAIPLVGSPSQVVAITKNKAYTRGVLSNEGVLMPKAVYLNARLMVSNAPKYNAEEICSKIGFPCVVKAACVEDSLGVFLVDSEEGLGDAISKALSLDDDVVIEQFIPGDEIRCGVIEDENGTLQVLPMFNYEVPTNVIRSNQLKLEYNDQGRPQKSSQTRIKVLKSADKGDEREGQAWERVGDAALQAFKVLNLRDFGLFDFRIHEKTGEAHLLEVNLFCSFGSASVVNAMARAQGYTDKELLQTVVRKAVARQ